MKIKFDWNKEPKQVSEGLVNEKTQLFLANEAKRFMDPYVPADNLALAQNVRVYTENGIGVVEYNSPYAHYQWNGELYGPNYPIEDGGTVVGYRSPPHKTPTGQKLHYSTSKHSLATSHWDEAMKRARKGDLTKSIQSYIERGEK